MDCSSSSPKVASRVAKTTLGACVVVMALGSGCASVAVRGPVQVQGRSFAAPAAHPGQEFGAGFSAMANPEISIASDDGVHTAVVAPFLRFDAQDRARTHFDLRQADYALRVGGFDFKGGIGRFNWGVLESVRLVDVINQTDAVEDIVPREKLGQPYVSVGTAFDFDVLGGMFVTVEALYFPVQRARTFVGLSGRLRPPTPIDPRPIFDSPVGALHPSGAVRAKLSGTVVDVAVSAFSGLSRDPRYVAQLTTPSVVARYDPLQQLGVEGTLNLDPILLKAEVVGRLYGSDFKPSVAAAVGAETTLFDLFATDTDLTLLTEYVFDARPIDAPPTPFPAHQFFVGGRYALNNLSGTEFRVGGIVDVEPVLGLPTFWGAPRVLKKTARVGQFTSLRVDGAHRLTDNWKVTGRLQVFGIESTHPKWWLAQDSYGELGIAYWF